MQSGDIGAIGMPFTDGATIVIYSQLDPRGFAAADGHWLWNRARLIPSRADGRRMIISRLQRRAR
jgi:hypothetical protein